MDRRTKHNRAGSITKMLPTDMSGGGVGFAGALVPRHCFIFDETTENRRGNPLTCMHESSLFFYCGLLWKGKFLENDLSGIATRVFSGRRQSHCVEAQARAPSAANG